MADLDQAPRQRDVLRRIAQLEAERVAVTTARLAADLGLPRQNVRTYLLALRDKGLIQYEAGNRQRALIQLTNAGRNDSELRFPILGTVAAGQPVGAEEHVERTIARLQDVLDLKEGDFFLHVRGDSMSGAGIYDGDLVALRPTQAEPLRGEIVLVLLPQEDTATLKRWNRLNGVVSLHSENAAHDPIILPADDVQIQGCLVGHIGTGRARKTLPLPMQS